MPITFLEWLKQYFVQQHGSMFERDLEYTIDHLTNTQLLQYFEVYQQQEPRK